MDGLKTGEDEIMKIVRSMSRLGLVLLVLASTAAASAEGGSWWAVALSPYTTTRDRDEAYGAAWNFAGRDQAEEAARAECNKRLTDPRLECFIHQSGRNSCFAVIYVVVHVRHQGTNSGYQVGAIDTTYAGAAAIANEVLNRDDGFGTVESGRIELVKCSGVE